MLKAVLVKLLIKTNKEEVVQEDDKLGMQRTTFAVLILSQKKFLPLTSKENHKCRLLSGDVSLCS